MTVFKRRLAHAERLALGAWIAVVVSGSLLLATLALTLLVRWLGLIVVAAVAVLVVAWARPRNKPSPPGSDGMRREAGLPAAPSAARTIWTQAVSPLGLVPSSRALGLVLLLATNGRRSGQPRGRALKRIAVGKAVLAIEVRGSIVPATVTEGVHHVGRT